MQLFLTFADSVVGPQSKNELYGIWPAPWLQTPSLYAIQMMPINLCQVQGSALFMIGKQHLHRTHCLPDSRNSSEL